jgi:hypothetical protein
MLILTQQQEAEAGENTIYVEGIPMLFNMDFISFTEQVMQSADAKNTTGMDLRADLVPVEVKFREETVTVLYRNVDAAHQIFFYNAKLPHVEAVFDTIKNYR